jgi:ABC-type antimicrobial peptide transport system permease subunit
MNNVTTVQKAISDQGYTAYSNMEWLEQAKQSMNIIQMVLGGIGAVSLLVAAIGIMNTMMMSIYERTKEIGVMKGLGCDMKDMRNMFLTESAMIGFSGGSFGVLISYLISFVINRLAAGSSSNLTMGLNGNISSIPPWLSGIAIVFAIFVGTLSGYFPSVRAMKLSPLQAIRNE